MSVKNAYPISDLLCFAQPMRSIYLLLGKIMTCTHHLQLLITCSDLLAPFVTSEAWILTYSKKLSRYPSA